MAALQINFYYYLANVQSVYSELKKDIFLGTKLFGGFDIYDKGS